jgi:RNA polymerase sigma-70 factor (ECF subfamily)
LLPAELNRFTPAGDLTSYEDDYPGAPMRRDLDRVYDEYLAACARAGDRAALERLALRFGPRLVGHAYRLLGDADAARDAVQDAWTDIVRGLPNLSSVSLFPAWAHRIVGRRCADAIRKKRRRRKLEAAFAAEPQAGDRELEALEIGADAARLRKALAELPPDQRAAVALFYREDLTIPEIAIALGTPGGTIKTRLMHARNKLRAALGLNAEGEKK